VLHDLRPRSHAATTKEIILYAALVQMKEFIYHSRGGEEFHGVVREPLFAEIEIPRGCGVKSSMPSERLAPGGPILLIEKINDYAADAAQRER